jgi:hypothetical protein
MLTWYGGRKTTPVNSTTPRSIPTNTSKYWEFDIQGSKLFPPQPPVQWIPEAVCSVWKVTALSSHACAILCLDKGKDLHFGAFVKKKNFENCVY